MTERPFFAAGSGQEAFEGAGTGTGMLLRSCFWQKPQRDLLQAHFLHAGIEQGFKNAIAGADKALVVTTPEVSAIRDADRIIGLLEANEIRDISLIINRLRPDMIARGDMMSVDDVTDILAVDLIGTILDDEQIVIATNQGEPLSGKSSQAEEEYMNICKRLLGEEIPFADINRKQGLLRKISSFFKK